MTLSVSAKRILFCLNHPSDAHLMNQVWFRLKDMGYQLTVAVPCSDRLADVCRAAGQEPVIWSPSGNGAHSGFFIRWRGLNQMITREVPDLIVGTDPVVAFAGRIFRRIPRVFIIRHDNVFKRFLIDPKVTRVLMFSSEYRCDDSDKTILCGGLPALGYLRPRYFRFDPAIVEKYHSAGRYYLFAPQSYSGRCFSDSSARQVVDMLRRNGTVFILSDHDLDTEGESLRLAVPAEDFFHVLAGAELLVSAGQTLASEAAVLGVPSIYLKDNRRVNPHLQMIEQQYGLAAGVSFHPSQKGVEFLEGWLRVPHLKANARNKRKVMLVENEDSVDLLVNAIRLTAEQGVPAKKRGSVHG